MIDKQKSLNTPRLLEVLVHVVAWLLIFGLPLAMMEYSSFYQWNILEYLRYLCFPMACGIVFYVNYAWLISHSLFRKGWKQFLLKNLLLIVSIGILIQLLMWMIHLGEMSHNLPSPPPSMLRRTHIIDPRIFFYMRDVMMLGFIAGLAVIIRMGRKWKITEQTIREAENARNDAELKTLRNQLSPHFLLNTLNNIYALIAFDTNKAQLAVLELSKMLRHMLYDNHQKFVSLQHEAEFIHNYVELMRLRLPREVKVEVDVEVDSGRNTMIAPLIFISLVENAFKHGISPTAPSFVAISLKEKGTDVCCCIRNSNFPKNESDKSGSGIGLEQVKRRLELLYPNQYEWQYGPQKNGEEYVSELTITITSEKQ